MKRSSRLSWREPVLFLFLIGTAVTPRSSGDAQTGSGCNERSTHIGLAGAVGGGTILARVCSQGDNLARVGSRAVDDALQVGGGAASRNAHHAANGAERWVAASRVDEVYDSQWEEAAEIIGRLASDSEIEKYPGYWKDAGVDLYLSDPARWTELGGDELLAMAAVRSPAMREAVKKQVQRRFDRALDHLSAVEHVGPRTIERVRQRHGVQLIEGPGQSFQLELRTADYAYRLLDTVIEEEPISDRARFSASAAGALLRATGADAVQRSPNCDLPGLFCFSALWPGDDDLRPWHYWVGPGLVLSHQTPDDFERLYALAAGGRSWMEANGFAELWIAFHQPAGAEVCPIWHGVAPPNSFGLPNEVLYTFSSVEHRDATCEKRRIQVPLLDRAEQPLDPLQTEGEDQGGQPGPGVAPEE